MKLVVNNEYFGNILNNISEFKHVFNSKIKQNSKVKYKKGSLTFVFRFLFIFLWCFCLFLNLPEILTVDDWKLVFSWQFVDGKQCAFYRRSTFFSHTHITTLIKSLCIKCASLEHCGCTIDKNRKSQVGRTYALYIWINSDAIITQITTCRGKLLYNNNWIGYKKKNKNKSVIKMRTIQINGRIRTRKSYGFDLPRRDVLRRPRVELPLGLKSIAGLARR